MNCQSSFQIGGAGYGGSGIPNALSGLGKMNTSFLNIVMEMQNQKKL